MLKRKDSIMIKKMQWGAMEVVVVLLLALGLFASPYAHAVDPSIQVSVGEAITIPGENVSKIAIADPAIADVVPLSDKELSIIGKKAGVTTLSLVKGDGSATQMSRIEVVNDSAAAAIRQMIGQPNITVRAVGDTLVLDGRVENELQAQRAGQIAAAYKDKVLNLLEVDKPRQIRIRTRVAEVNTDDLKNVGFQWFGPQGQVQYAMQYVGGGSIVSGFIPTASEFGSTGAQIQPNTVSMTLLLDLLLTKNYARLLSEPTLVTLSGKEASFLVGEEVPIVEQLPQSFTVEFKEVGVRMNIKPTVDSQNQINTTVHAEVSQILSTGANGIPIIGTKKADAALQLKDGQTMVIGGLLENNIDADTLRKVPWLADIPLFGYLFRDKHRHQAQREVLFFVTTEVVKDNDYSPQTPAMQDWTVKATKHLLNVPKTDVPFPWHHDKSESAPKKPAVTAKPAASTKPVSSSQTAAAPAAKPEATAPAQDTSSNFSPARPAE